MGQINCKYILIVAVLASIAGGGVFYQWWTFQNEVKRSSIEIPKINIERVKQTEEIIGEKTNPEQATSSPDNLNQPVNSVILYPNGGEKWERGKSYEIRWNLLEADYPVSIEVIAQDYSEESPNYCQIFFGSDKVDPSSGKFSLGIPDDACLGRYKVQICKYDELNFELSVCYENNDFFRITAEPDTSCTYPNASTDWGDGLYGCPAGSGQNKQRCYQGICKTCAGFLAYDPGAKKFGCWYLANPATSCEEFCGERGSMEGYWTDDQKCTLGKTLTGCINCSTDYENGWWVPYYNIVKNICYRNMGAGTYYSSHWGPDLANLQRMCVCNY